MLTLYFRQHSLPDQWLSQCSGRPPGSHVVGREWMTLGVLRS
jgi:hypothetical protein